MEVMDDSIVYQPPESEVISSKSSMKKAAIRFSEKPGRLQDVQGLQKNILVQIPYVQPLSGYFTWYWDQDSTIYHTVTIQNFGPGSASGRVIFTSVEDSSSASTTFSDLAANTSTTVTIPYQVIRNQSSIGIKLMALAVKVDPYNVTTWAQNLSVYGVEKYNNDATHLPDPDDGDNLETSDLYHFPFNEGYTVVLEAATAGDNTNSPIVTAERINDYVNTKMNYTFSDIYNHTATSDRYVMDNGYTGICDEYATLDTSFSRALGIPTRFLGITWINSEGVTEGHGILENRIQDRWVHSDPTWDVFDNAQIYKSGNRTHMNLTKFTDADDSRYNDTEDMVDGDGILSYEDMISDPLGELPGYN